MLLVNSSFRGGGITSYAKEIISSYQGINDNTISVVIGDDNISPIDFDNVRVDKLDCEKITKDGVLRLLNIINTLQPDVILNSNANLMTICVPYISDKIKVISVAHSLKYSDADVAGFNAKFVDTVISLSNFSKKYLVRRFKIHDKCKVETVHNFVRATSSPYSCIESKLNGKTIIIVYPGGCSSAKAPDTVFRIVSKLIQQDLDFRFYWLGDTSLPYLHHFSEHVELDRFISDPRVVFTGKVSHELSVKIIESANIFLFPSRREGCPMSLLEAMKVGTIPIISNAKHASLEIIEDGYNGYVVKQNDINGYVARIEDIIRYHNKYRAIYTHCVDSFIKKLDFPIWKNKMDNIIFNEPLQHKARNKKFNVLRYFFDKLLLLTIFFLDRIASQQEALLVLYNFKSKLLKK